MTTVQPISPVGMVLGLALMALTIFLMRRARLPLTKDLLIGTARTYLQLIAVGFLLEYIFAARQWYWVMGLLAIMIAIAGHTAIQRLKGKKRPGIYTDASLAILLGSGISIFWVNEVVIHVQPWYHPQYLIPLAGMIIGNSMNSAALTMDRFLNELEQRRNEVETLLAMGASAKRAAQEAIQAAIMAAMIPNINAMMVVGLISLPGMMTGQILAGQSPLAAVTYQIIVMLMLTCAAAVTSMTCTHLLMKKSFNAAEQLITTP